MTLSVREIEDRLEEAAWTLRRLPEKNRPRGYASSWPPIVRDAGHAYGYTPGAPMRVVPSAAAISRMEECFDWLMMLDPEDARIVSLRAENVRWKQICIRAGCLRSTAWRRWAAALLTISKKPEKQAKTGRQAGAGKAPAATGGAMPRESRAEPEDNAQDALNFGRDTSSGFGQKRARLRHRTGERSPGPGRESRAQLLPPARHRPAEGSSGRLSYAGGFGALIR